MRSFSTAHKNGRSATTPRRLYDFLTQRSLFYLWSLGESPFSPSLPPLPSWRPNMPSCARIVLCVLPEFWLSVFLSVSRRVLPFSAMQLYDCRALQRVKPQFQLQPASFGFVVLPVPARGSSCAPFLPCLRRGRPISMWYGNSASDIYTRVVEKGKTESG